jgi:hypothetical protein
VHKPFTTMRKDELVTYLESILVCLDVHERALHEVVTRRSGEVPPELRAEMPINLYEPLLRTMIDLGLRP